MQIEMIERPRARNRDPVTSFEAAKKAEKFAGTHAGRILGIFYLWPGLDWTAHELAGETGLTIVQLDRRLPELAQIERTGHTVNGFTVWRLKQEGCYFTELGEADREKLLEL